MQILRCVQNFACGLPLSQAIFAQGRQAAQLLASVPASLGSVLFQFAAHPRASRCPFTFQRRGRNSEHHASYLCRDGKEIVRVVRAASWGPAAKLHSSAHPSQNTYPDLGLASNNWSASRAGTLFARLVIETKSSSSCPMRPISCDNVFSQAPGKRLKHAGPHRASNRSRNSDTAEARLDAQRASAR